MRFNFTTYFIQGLLILGCLSPWVWILGDSYPDYYLRIASPLTHHPETLGIWYWPASFLGFFHWHLGAIFSLIVFIHGLHFMLIYRHQPPAWHRPLLPLLFLSGWMIPLGYWSDQTLLPFSLQQWVRNHQTFFMVVAPLSFLSWVYYSHRFWVANIRQRGMRFLQKILFLPDLDFKNSFWSLFKRKSQIKSENTAYKLLRSQENDPPYPGTTTEKEELEFAHQMVNSQESSTEVAPLLPFQDSDLTFFQQVKLKKEKKASTPEVEVQKIPDIHVLIKSMVKQSKAQVQRPADSYFLDITQKIEEKLSEFRIEGKIINILKGPVVDTFELELGPGMKVSKVNSITEDLSLALCGSPIRLVYPLAGKSTMGIEVPRTPREIIFLDEVLSSFEFTKTKHRLPICMGKDAYGETFVVDLASMPHMLIAGSTGAGKSVFLNTLLVSLLIKCPPADMKLLLIDPKQLELALYSELPHLCMPVITEGKKAAISLMWACQEMERRYSILKLMGVRALDVYNQKINQITPEQKRDIAPFFASGEDFKLPYLVIIVDEFADLILTKFGKEIENNICRLAAKARACGIHLVIATQRPSVDVITGLIKSNFPTRVSFKVTTNVDSRTILSAQGAEKLLGMGDMLYKHNIDLRRLHSAFVSEDEIESLMMKLKPIKPKFNQEAMDFMERFQSGKDGDMAYNESSDSYYASSTVSDGNNDYPTDEDEKFSEAWGLVAQHQKASASFLQRRLGIGYNRAANLIETMEKKGLVGPAQGAKPREIYSGQDQL